MITDYDEWARVTTKRVYPALIPPLMEPLLLSLSNM